MSFPLGPRTGAGERRLKRDKALCPIPNTYVCRVAVPPKLLAENPATLMIPEWQRVLEGLEPPRRPASQRSRPGSPNGAYAEWEMNAVSVVLHRDDSIQQALQKIIRKVEMEHRQSLARPASAYCVFRAFADFSIDFSGRPLHGDSPAPIQPLIEFPYYLSLQVIPYQLLRDEIVRDSEPEARRQLLAEQRAFAAFATGYAALLRKMHQQYTSLMEREEEMRRAKERQRAIALENIRARILLQEQEAHRALVEREEHAEWERLLLEIAAVQAKLRAADELRAAVDAELRARYAELKEIELTEARARILTARFAALEDFGESLLHRHAKMAGAAYTEARIASTCCSAGAADCSNQIEHFDRRRADVGRLRNRSLYDRPDVANDRSIANDVFLASLAPSELRVIDTSVHHGDLSSGDDA